MARPRLPVTTITVLVVTGMVTAAQLVFPPVLAALRRDPQALADGQWWRTFSPLFVQAGGWPQIIVNNVAIALIGTMAERVFGPARWLWLYFGCGVLAEIPSYLWHPYGGGNSVAGAGLLGGLIGLAMLHWRELPRPARICVVALPVLAVVGTALRDNHGGPFLLGIAVAWLFARRDPALRQRIRPPWHDRGQNPAPDATPSSA